MSLRIFLGARLFDGSTLRDGLAVLAEAGTVTGIVAADSVIEAPAGSITQLRGGILAPAFLDLQVNGGAGLMVDEATDPGDLRRICATHLALGCAGVLPTLITATPQATAQVIDAGIAAAMAQVPGFLGLHLEGPHLDPR
ncbi:MAG: N-acetylglucosamine-6-phosphate deacetylase, partial [Paracoccaceae bacterium]|nr:N-acetylglucosamine-6-phosphate deacetylase [Paracoccaceae bacterium]